MFTTNYKITVKVKKNATALAILNAESTNEKVNTQEINEFILSLFNNSNEKEDEYLLDSFEQIAYLSSINFELDSIFLSPQFLLELLKNYLYVLQIESAFIICHNIIADPNFNSKLFDVLTEANYIVFFLNNYQDEYFLPMLNMLIYKTYCINHESLHTFYDIIPLLIDIINSPINNERFYAIDSLCYLITLQDCFNFALENELIPILEKSLAFSNAQLFIKSLNLINLIHEYDRSICIQDAGIVSLILRHIEYAKDLQIKIIIDYFKSLIIEDSQTFFELNIINELLTIILTCSFKKKKEIIFFFAQSFSIIFNRCSQFLNQEIIEDTDIVFNNTMIHDIITNIMETCLSFEDERCLFCLNVINFYFENNFEDANLAAEEVCFPNVLLEISTKDDLSEDVINFAHYIFSSYFEGEEDENEQACDDE